MGYLFLGILAIALVILTIRTANKRRVKGQLKGLRSSWGQPKIESPDFDSISRYAEVDDARAFHRLTAQTIQDIDFHGLFAFIDRTTSKVGQQFLYKKVIEPTDNIDRRSEDLIDVLTIDRQLREEIQLELLKLNNSGAYYIPSLLKGKVLEKPKWFGLLILDVLIVTLLFILSFKFQALLLWLLIPITLNIFLHYWNKGNTFQFLRSFPQLNNLINVSRMLIKRGGMFDNKPTEESIASLRSFQRSVSLIRFESGSGIQAELAMLGTYLTELVKAVFLLEVFALYRITKELESKKSAIKTLFDYVGSIDASISIASLRADKDKTCRPTMVSPRKTLMAKGMYHPLIDNCVPNDLVLNGKSILITGSNMSGKSTFLRTLTINSILAQTINTCFAEEFISPILRQHSSIRIDDNLFDGKSYYFQEVNIMASLLTEVESPGQNLFVLDEVFKGTNTIERIAAGKAILSFLNRNDNIVIVSTHDIELADMLEAEYDLYHFTETVENSELHFDHKIKAGQLRTRNAIKILEMANYPADVTREAKEISSDLSTSRITTEK
jgi:DNA mismatch repair ATPase MutS